MLVTSLTIIPASLEEQSTVSDRAGGRGRRVSPGSLIHPRARLHAGRYVEIIVPYHVGKDECFMV